ncbi:MAG: methionyl-tRNA formyltransferase [Oscillospiraceae bacterium]|nr:methionyl-tRNA formyltransferase [Oscillospiraceae bacterium]
MKIVFMGTPVFSLACLEALIEAGHEVKAVFTQPDKPKNRGKQIMMTPVKECALKHDIPVYQPLSLRKGEDAETSMAVLREIAPDCIVVVAYGQILPKEVLELPKYGCINVHASLLPMYRGAAPIQRVIQNGETVSGVNTMYMAEGLDTGDMIMKEEVAVPDDMTGAQLHDALSECGAALIVKTLEALENGTAVRTPQEGDTCYASMISKEELKIDFTKPAKQVYDFIRAMSDAPCAYTLLEGKRMKVYMSRLVENVSGEAGTIANVDDFTVVCGDGNGVALTEIQPEGGKRMETAAYLRGKKLEKGAALG